MRRFVFGLVPAVLTALATLHCSDDAPSSAPAPVIDAGLDAHPAPPVVEAGPADAALGPDIPDPPLVPATKVDLLFVVDNSASMGTKQTFLANAVNRLLGSFPVKDIHVGVISSSLGNSGGDVCPIDKPRTDDHAHLLNMTAGPTPTVVPGAEKGFLALGSGPGAVSDLATLEARTADLIRGVDQTGCGLENQLEAMYRFVSQPDPPLLYTLDSFKQAAVSGVDYELLKQRKAFFRPDSAVAIVMITDEDDGSIDSLSVGGFGYAFNARDFPGSNVKRGATAQGTTAPRGTSICLTDPLNVDCTSCGFAASCDPNASTCQKIRSDVNCTTSTDPASTPGFFGPADDDLNVRMVDMRRRYGIEPRYPIGRYVTGLSTRRVPDRADAHPESLGANGQRSIAEYIQAKSCTNPLFATGLPEKEGDELCHLADNERSSRLVYFGLIGGVPSTLLAGGPDWTKIVGQSPERFDRTGLDPHMVQSIDARPPLTGTDKLRGDNGTDPINGREWNTQKKDLQFACTFPLPAPLNCALNADSCDCADPPGGGTGEKPSPPLCATDGSATQIRGKAYPTFRELVLARALGDRAVVGSICELDAQSSYGAFLGAFAAKVNGAIAK